MAQGRLNRDQFFEKLAEMVTTDLKKALWTLYRRGAAPLRERIEAIIDPQSAEVRDRGVKSPPDPGLVTILYCRTAFSTARGHDLADQSGPGTTGALPTTRPETPQDNPLIDIQMTTNEPPRFTPGIRITGDRAPTVQPHEPPCSTRPTRDEITDLTTAVRAIPPSGRPRIADRPMPVCPALVAHCGLVALP